MRGLSQLGKIAGLIGLMLVLLAPFRAAAEEHFVYSVYRGVDLGNPGELPRKDFYVTLGSNQGVKKGSILDVRRRVASYDLVTQKLYRDVTFPIARLKVIHVESNAAIARLEKFLPADQTPATSPFAVMVGDLVQLSGP